MKVTGKTVMVHFEEEVTVGNGAIEATLMGQAFVYCNDDADFEFIDITNMKFMGMPIENNYEGFKKFKTKMSELGINIDEMFEAKFNELLTSEFKMKLKAMYHG